MPFGLNLNTLEKRQKNDYFQYYNENGELLILISKEHGHGWSTQCTGEEQLRLASDTVIIDYFFKFYDEEHTLKKKYDAKKFFKSSLLFPSFFNYESIHCLRPHFVLKNKIFQIREYDGVEKIYYYNSSLWFQS
jgi:hypothetical protein